MFIYLAPTQSLVIKEGSAASAKPDPPSGAKRGNPLCVEIFLEKKISSARISFVLSDYFEKWILKTMEYT